MRRTHRDRRGGRNEASAAKGLKGGWQAQESCGDATVQGGVVISFPSMIRPSTSSLVLLHTPRSRSRSPPQWSTFS